MTTKEWQYLESELDTYSTMETVMLTSENSDDSLGLDETAERCVPLLTKTASVADLNDLFMAKIEFSDTFYHEEIMQEDLPHIPMQTSF